MKKAEFLETRQAWRDKWNAFFEADDGGAIPSGFDLNWRCVVACHAEGCPNGGRYYVTKIGEQLDGVYRVQCGRCLSEMTDLDPMLEDDEDFRLETSLPDGSSWMIREEDDD